MIARLFLIFGLLLAAADTASARQHLVSPGTDWQILDNQVRPGDEIILMPGTHRPAELFQLQATAEQRIVIRGLDPDHPALIEAGRYGLRLHGPRWVTVRDLHIQGAAVSGMVIDTETKVGSGPKIAPAGEEPAESSRGHVTLQRLTISSTGPTGKRHALEVSGLKDVRIEDCRFDGWAGSAMEIAACVDVQIRRCSFTGRDDHSQADGVHIRAGSDRVLIDQCRFDQAAARCVNIGAADDLADFRSPVPDDARPASVYQASRVTVTRNVITGGGVPFFVSHADACVIRNNTVVRPGLMVIAVGDTTGDPRLAPSRGTIIGANLFLWRTGDLKRLAEVAEAAGPECLVLEENLWWSDESAEDRRKLGPLPVEPQWPQVTEVDPRLDRDLKPTNEAAELFGAHAP